MTDANLKNKAFNMLDQLTETFKGPELVVKATQELARRYAFDTDEVNEVLNQWLGTPKSQKGLLAE
jgi:hypothetical protein